MQTGRRWRLAGLAAGVLMLGALTTACGGEKDSDSAAGSTSEVTSSASQPLAADARGAEGGAAGQRSAAQAPAPSGGQPQPGTASLPSLDRKIIYTASLDLTVKDVQAEVERIALIAEGSGGLVAKSNVREEGDFQRGTIEIRVPVGRYQEALGQIRRLAVKVKSENSSANDVSEEFVDLQARQRTLEATEQQLITFLGQAKTVQETLQVQDRLNTVRTEIERIRGRANALTRLTDLATIQVQLAPEAAPVVKVEPDTGIGAAFVQGWEASLAVLGALGAALATVLAFSWWLIPLVALGLWWVRREQRRRPIRAAVPGTPPAPAEGTGGAA